MNSFGRKFRVTIFGESHGESLGVIIDGCPSGIALGVEDMMPFIERRRSGARGTTLRHESDLPRFVSGVWNGYTTGAPITVLFANEDRRSQDYTSLADTPRPGHADFTARAKYSSYTDPRGGGHFSGRLTLAVVAAGAVARKVTPTVVYTSQIVEIGGECDPQKFDQVIDSAFAAGDSVGGIVECRVSGIAAGLGEPFFDSVESMLSHAIFSIPAIKGIEFGSGFNGSRLRGSQNNDPIIDLRGTTATNNAGGINGGITNGNEIVMRVAIKPTSSISSSQHSINLKTGEAAEIKVNGRHDTCIALRMGVIIESMAAITMADFELLQK